VEAEFPWMTYVISLFVLVVLSIALSLLAPHRDRRYGLPAPHDGADQRHAGERTR
jgi:hypothetical protein